ncbi:hypothetical protein THIOM_002696 [Candidatus Thiomargarita nelsonii]|uniref:Uncharacterized protein n=1 Tax=Candidatus Thiomargarita nelsonii TaxID=1003181 RepID=A0A176S0E2_9GAMM|nr:hypothetical protein THIOM_002696 [Candidatus Thiomargarita nelsonii]
MKELLNALDEIIVPRFKQRSAILEEPKNAAYPSTKIRKVGKALFCQFDTDELDIFPYFNQTVPFLNSMCDYTIFYPYENTMFVFLCELKTEKVNNSSKQLESAKLFAEFLINMAEKHLNFKKFMIEYRALIFSTSDKRRFSTNVKKDAYSQYQASQLKYKHLKAGRNCYLDHHCY